LKFTKYFSALIAAVAMLAIAPRAEAQKVGVYQIFTGGTTRALALTTNDIALGLVSTNQYGLPGTPTNIIQTVGNFDYVGITWSFTGGSNAVLQVFRCKDNGLTFNTNSPDFTYTSTAVTPGWTTNATLDVHGDSHIAFVLQNKGTLDLTNLILSINCKSGTTYTKPATQ